MTNDDSSQFENEDNQKSNNEKKSLEDHASKFIDEKRRHLERRLSASQRDPFLSKKLRKTV